MRNVLSIILFSCIISSGLLSQQIHQLRGHADEQFATGNFTAALKEYQRILFFGEDHGYDEVYGRIADIYFQLEDYENAIVYYDFAGKAVSSDSLKLEYAFSKILCYFKQDRFMLGLSDIYDLPGTASPYFEAKKNLYAAICHFGLGETDQSLQYFAGVVDSSGMAQIETLVADLRKHEKKFDPDKLEMMSIFLPGLGQLVGGDIKNGLNSILLLGGIAAYSLHTAVTYSILDGTLFLLTWFYRYYTGGHKKAYELGTDKIREQQRITYHQILDVVRHHALY
ncbi:MAG TPA: hypothetical protein ENO20_09200 [Bacteroides sp.]|nr:hypothetical protein [Bacteroides sp.]